MVAAWRTVRAFSQTIIGGLCMTFIGMQGPDVEAANIGRYAKNLNFPSQCTEEDNVNIPLYGGYVSDYKITATFPTYYPLKDGQEDLCTTNYTHCERSWDMRPTAQIAYYDATERKLKFAWQSPGYYWYPIETPDNVNGNIGRSVSLAYPPTNRHGAGLGAPPAMSYYDASNKRLMYIVREIRGNWGEPEIVDTSGDVGQYSALRIGRDRRHHLVYYDADNRDLKYTYKADPGAVGGWATPIILDATGDVGQYAAMAIGPMNTIHVVYYDATAMALKYIAHTDQAAWSTPVVLDAAGDVGSYASITVYYEGREEKMAGAYAGRHPHMAYYDASNGDVKYIYQDEHGWSTPMVLDANGDVGQYSSIAFGPDGSLHLAYYDATNHDLKYRHKDVGTASWSAPQVLDADGNVGQFASLGVSAKGYPNIAYYDADNRRLKFISKTKTTMPNWDQPRVIAAGGAGQYASLVTSGFVVDIDQIGIELYNDGEIMVKVVKVSGWPFASGMSVNVVEGKSMSNQDYIRIHKRVDDRLKTPEIFVLYANGYARIKPLPPVGREEPVCYGASVILGPAQEDADFPIAMIHHLDLDPKNLTLKVRYEDGSAAVLHLQSKREKTTLQVTDVTYDTLTVPFATLRSMWVADNDCDIAKVEAKSASGTVQTYTMDPHRQEWTTIPSDAWYFHRPTYSRHNTSCPDFKIEVLGPKGYMVTKQAEDYRSGTLTKTARKTASGGYTVRGPGEASYDLHLTQDITNACIRLRYTKGDHTGDLVKVSVDGVQQPTLELSHEGTLGDYYMTKQVNLLSGVSAGSHTVRLEIPTHRGEVELDYLAIHSKVAEQGDTTRSNRLGEAPH